MGDSNKVEALDLYAKVEDLLGVKDVAPKLHNIFFDILDTLEFKSILDIGCGSGDFLEEVRRRYEIDIADGIDKSLHMVEIANSKGLSVTNRDLKEIDNRYDIVTATFDMVNYLNPEEFIEFFSDLKRVLKEGGYFIFDINSQYALSQLAVGNFIAEDDDRFLTIESFYEAGVYDSIFTLFEKSGDCYRKSFDSIRQYYYSEEFISLLSGWKLKDKFPIKLYEMESDDKILYILKNIG